MAMINFPRRQSGYVTDLPLIKPETVNKYIGVTYPFNNSRGVFFKSYTNYQQVLTNLHILLITSKGERYLQPEFLRHIKKCARSTFLY